MYRFEGKLDDRDSKRIAEVFGAENLLADETRLPIRYVMLNPADIRLTGTASFYRGNYVKMLSAYEIQRIRSPLTEEDETLRNSLSPEVIKEIKKINVEKAPFGVFTNQSNKNIYVTNVQSHSVSVIDKKNHKVVKNIKVGKWPYQVAFDNRKNIGYVSNQRENSISLIDLNTLEIIETKKDISRMKTLIGRKKSA